MIRIIIVPLLMISLHPVHVSLTTIDQAEGSDTMMVHLRMYYDDFLRDYALHDKDFNMEKIQTFPAENAGSYFNDRVRIYVNNKLLSGQIMTLSVLDNEIFLKLFCLSDKDPGKIKVINKILTGLYNDQTNMIFIKIGKNEHAMRLTPDNEKETWTFKE